MLAQTPTKQMSKLPTLLHWKSGKPGDAYWKGSAQPL